MSSIQKSVVVFERLDDNALRVAMGIALDLSRGFNRVGSDRCGNEQRLKKSGFVFELDDNALGLAVGVVRICRHSLHS